MGKLYIFLLFVLLEQNTSIKPYQYWGAVEVGASQAVIYKSVGIWLSTNSKKYNLADIISDLDRKEYRASISIPIKGGFFSNDHNVIGNITIKTVDAYYQVECLSFVESSKKIIIQEGDTDVNLIDDYLNKVVANICSSIPHSSCSEQSVFHR